MSSATFAQTGWCSCGAVLLAAAPASVASRDEVLRPVSRDQLCVTEGSITSRPDGSLMVGGSKMRAVVPAATQPTAEADFTYLGPTAETSALGSGEVRRQFGLKLRAQDPCNLVYAMWRFEPKPEVVVQVKSNPGQHESSVCHNNGYATVRPSRAWPVEAPSPGASHRLTAQTRGSSLTVMVDGAPAWQGDIGSGPAGEIGIRSDNVRLSLALLAPIANGVAGQCPSGGED